MVLQPARSGTTIYSIRTALSTRGGVPYDIHILSIRRSMSTSLLLCLALFFDFLFGSVLCVGDHVLGFVW